MDLVLMFIFFVYCWFGANCFRVSDFKKFQQKLSNETAESDERSNSIVSFKLYNRDYREGTPLRETREDIPKFQAGLPLVVVTHGWTANASTSSVMDIVTGYLQFYDMNIITVDWSSLSTENYFTASQSTKEVGEAVGDKVLQLQKEKVCSLDKTHLIGHSLGAHVMGVAGFRVQVRAAQSVSRITGLDPAGPLFEYLNGDQKSKLGPEDAEFVDAIHTDPVFGYAVRMAQADFFPNGGLAPQPGCLDLSNIFCSHERSFQYYAESIGNSSSFLSTKCNLYKAYLANRCEDQPKAHMGHSAPRSANGGYYLRTRSSSPFSL